MDIRKFTTNSQQALQEAQAIAFENKHPQIDVVHLLSALLEQKESIVLTVLKKMEVPVEQVSAQAKSILGKIPKGQVVQQAGQVAVTGPMNFVLVNSEREAKNMGDEFVSTEHLLLSILKVDSPAAHILNVFGVDYIKVKQILTDVRGDQKIDSADPENKRDVISKYTTDLTEEARQEKLDPIIGRDDEIRRVLQVLSRRRKNNPVLIGEPGVGKTAIAEGLAQRIVAGDVPENLKDKQVLSLDIGSIVAGSKFRGEFEERMKAILQEVKKNPDKYIVFIDELHTIVGAGSIEGSLDASNLLKPVLARGELHCVGATTLKEYQKHIEKDAALERRFQPVMVLEPTLDDTIAILRGIKEKYEVHHGVRITDDAVVAAGKLSLKYISDRFLPDKAIDLIDEATSALRIELNSMPNELDQLKRKIMKLEIEKQAIAREKTETTKKKTREIEKDLAELKETANQLELHWKKEKELINQIQEDKKDIDKLKQEADILERKAEYDRVAEIRYGLIPEKEKSIKSLQSRLKKVQSGPGGRQILKEEVTEEDIAAVVSKWTGIPVSKMLQSEIEKLTHAEDELAKRVIGQKKSIVAVSNALRRSRAGLSEENRPIGSFLFLGPTGVGKTELAKALAEFMFNSEDAIVRVDMSEFMEKHSVSKLIGSPPGYVGYDEGGQLTEKVRRRPYSVVLFDEIEKAHPEVFNSLLQLLDDGHLTDSKGRKVNFKNTIIIMTSNIGSDAILDSLNKSDLGFGNKEKDLKQSTDDKIMGKLKDHFRPEFLNRIDEIIIFNALSKADIRQIVDLQLDIVAKRLLEKEIQVNFRPELKDMLAEQGYDPQFGARPLKRLIQSKILDELALQIIEGSAKDKVKVDFKRGKVQFDTK
ncbi:ATP-dependent chaperone ClpB [Candidatus Falkowbacteria bacterium]|jgi:ATP-dependent Clp protease ATP-binding subunit ClpB|nr:ATP-dependent chaperone ClpB [Candidatus Falkowbacteria bacterium]MBT5502698.1 ATP-dependent chaperone ClpB [Candidatus Falkowbacteria bacterium]MBT6573518.1 ATP-dependent chaperone ClpB [Candidatus Falkowbacteria bacterium]MBT7348068.1 ATP-dependent chaperone ClpB [Candidatus Falkowbacteria bacterium]MBT7501097.1 ATP-dependent chaperone ClpB [Candidatus Falkowbacteria bacterium]